MNPINKIVGKHVTSKWGRDMGVVVSIEGDSMRLEKPRRLWKGAKNRKLEIDEIDDIEAERLQMRRKSYSDFDNIERMPERYFIL